MSPSEELKWLDWIQSMSLDELRRERAFEERGCGGESHWRKLADKRIREIDREIASRQESE